MELTHQPVRSLLPAVSVVRDERQRILNAADVLFFDDSNNAKPAMDDVARAVGLSLAAFTRHFASRDALLEAVVDYRHDAWLARLDECCQEAADPTDQLLLIYTFLERSFSVETALGHAFTTIYTRLGYENPWVRTMMVRHATAFTTTVEALAIAADLPRSTGSQLAILAAGAHVSAGALQSVSPIREARSAAAQLVAMYRVDVDYPEF